MGDILTKQQILDAHDIKIERVENSYWGGDHFVKVMNGPERDEFDTFIYNRDDEKDLRGMRVLLCKLCICDEEGVRMFVSDEDVKALTNKSGAGLMVAFQAAQKLNALTKEDIGGMEENSEPGQSDASSSD